MCFFVHLKWYSGGDKDFSYYTLVKFHNPLLVIIDIGPPKLQIMKLPFPSPPFASTTSPQGPPSAILIADDDPLMRKSIAIICKRFKGFKVFEARDGTEALNIIKRETLDLILLDEQMPGRSGMSVCRELRKLAETVFTPVLLFTGHGGEEKKIEALEAGANDFMSKPLSPVELKVRVNNLLLSNFHQKSLDQKNRELEVTLKKLEDSSAQLIRSERLLAMSRLSSGMLHHLGNPLNHTKLALTLAERFLPDPNNEGKKCQESLEDAAEELDRVIAVVQHLRGFSQGNKAAAQIFDLSQAIRTSIMGSRSNGTRVEIEESIPDNIEFNGDLMLVSQIVTAINQNALDAFSREGNPSEPNRIEVTLEENDGLVEITHSDNGGGIAPEILSKVTDPFFTTKLSGSGAGLGLAFVEAVVSLYDGSLHVSSLGGLTTVRVRLMRS